MRQYLCWNSDYVYPTEQQVVNYAEAYRQDQSIGSFMRWLGVPDQHKVILCNLDLRGKNLSTANFNGCKIEHVNLEGANLSGCNFNRSVFYHVNMSYADLSNTDFSNTEIDHCQITGANLYNSSLDWAYMNRVEADSAIMIGLGKSYNTAVNSFLELNKVFSLSIDDIKTIQQLHVLSAIFRYTIQSMDLLKQLTPDVQDAMHTKYATLREKLPYLTTPLSERLFLQSALMDEEASAKREPVSKLFQLRLLVKGKENSSLSSIPDDILFYRIFPSVLGDTLTFHHALLITHCRDLNTLPDTQAKPEHFLDKLLSLTPEETSLLSRIQAEKQNARGCILF